VPHKKENPPLDLNALIAPVEDSKCEYW
jgi:hypothetical protein